MYDKKDLVDISHLGLIFQAKPVKYMTKAVYESLAMHYELNDLALTNILRNKLKHATGGNGHWTLPPCIWMIEYEEGLLLLFPEELQPPSVGGA